MENTKGLEQRMDFLQQRLDMVREEVESELWHIDRELEWWKRVAVISMVANAGWLGFFAWLVTR